MINYPFLEKGATIGVTAPSSGVPDELHEMFKTACNRMEMKGFSIVCGDTVWTQNKAKSSPGKKRADEFNEMMRDENIHIIIPPWGGELLIEILEYIDFDNIQKKWILGYSDIVPPQVTLINGAFTEVESENGKGTILQYFYE